MEDIVDLTGFATTFVRPILANTAKSLSQCRPELSSQVLLLLLLLHLLLSVVLLLLSVVLLLLVVMVLVMVLVLVVVVVTVKLLRLPLLPLLLFSASISDPTL